MVTEFDLLSRAHMTRQVREVSTIQVALGRLWDRTMDPSDIKGSFERYSIGATKIINAGRTSGELSAQEYYEELRLLAEVGGDPERVQRQPVATDGTRKALRATGLSATLDQIKKGKSPEAALAIGKAAMLRSAKRRTLNAGRQRLIALSDADGGARGWARVSDGGPCYFCAMLVSRGPVYTAGTVNFQAHDGCGCSVRPVFYTDPTNGWSPDALAYKDLWNQITPEGFYGGGDWRATYARAMADPSSPLSKALAGSYALAA